MWTADSAPELDGRAMRVAIRSNGTPLTRADVLELWKHDDRFCEFFVALLRDAPYAAYFFETPPWQPSLLGRPFEFVLVDSAELARVEPEPETFQEHFEAASAGESVLTFPNLRGDATLVVPRPEGEISAYAHLAACVRNAPAAQARALWSAAAAAVEQRLGTAPLWLSTAGLGVYWLHLRIDSIPKYYRHAAYRSLS